MEIDADATVPTASIAMMQSVGIANGGAKKHEYGRRHRSKSEGHDLHHANNLTNDVIPPTSGGPVKSAKEKNHDRKNRNAKGRGLPKKGVYNQCLCYYSSQSKTRGFWVMSATFCSALESVHVNLILIYRGYYADGFPRVIWVPGRTSL